MAFSTGLDAKTRRRGEDVVTRILNGRVAQGDGEGEGDEPAASVLVVGTGTFTKSFKTLLALARGASLVSISWIEAVAAAKTWVDPAAHLLSDAAAERRERFDLRAAHERFQAHGPLLAGVRCLVAPAAARQEKDGGGGLRQLMGAAGARVVESAAELGGKGGECGKQGRVLVLGVPEDRPWARKALPKGAPVLGREALVSALLTQSFDWGKPLFKAGE